MTDPTPETTPTRDEAVRHGRSAIVHAVASLAAAISLLERTPKAKKAAPSDRMFDQMLKDYRKALDEARRALASAPASGRVDAVANLDSRMTAAGMIPLSDLISGNTPLERWAAHTGVSDLDTFEQWLTRKQREFGTMKAGYELGDKDKDDELYEWVLSHFAAFNEVAANLRQMKARMAFLPAATPVSEAGGERLLRQLRALAVALHAKHYPDVTQWRPLDDAEGLLSQIDNMTACLTRRSDEADEVARLTAELAAVRAELRRESSARDFAAALAKPASSPAGDVVRQAGAFLVDRLHEFESEMNGGEPERYWIGHILPALARFKTALSQSTSAGRGV